MSTHPTMSESVRPEHISKRVQNYDMLMTRRVRSILLVASRYDYFTFQGTFPSPAPLLNSVAAEDGQLTQSLFNTCAPQRHRGLVEAPLPQVRGVELHCIPAHHSCLFCGRGLCRDRQRGFRPGQCTSSAPSVWQHHSQPSLLQIISLLRVGNTDIFAFVETMHKRAPGVPIVLLATTQVATTTAGGSRAV